MGSELTRQRVPAVKNPANGSIQRHPAILTVNRPGDRFEQEADRTAAAVVGGNRAPATFSLSAVPITRVQREDAPKGKTDEEKYKEAGDKLKDAFLATPLGKDLQERVKQDKLVKGATEAGKSFISTLPGKIITGAAAAGAVATLAATHKELPAQIPEIPLDVLTPGLSVEITYKGPVDKPTEAMITFKFAEQTPKGGGKKPAMTESEKYRAETARIAADQAKFKAGYSYPPGSPEDLQQKAQEEAAKSALAKYAPGPDLAAMVKKYPWLQAPQPKSGLQLEMPKPSFGYKPPSLLGDEYKLKLPGEQQKKKDDEPMLQRKATDATQVNAAPPIVHEALDAPGQPLDAGTRAFMETRFGYDFSRVRVHTDQTADQSTRAVNALAYTVGSHVVFGAGRYAPQTHEGARLIAHELTHVVQNQVDSSHGHIQRYESPEHQDLGDKNLEDLFGYIQTDEGKKWTKERGIDAAKLIREIEQDPVRCNKTIKVRPGLELTPGQIISLMGDFYATWQDLKSAPKEEIDQILAVMKKERTGGVDANAEYEKITKGRYTKLARVNTKHFAPKNKESWQELHVQAIEKAKKAGIDKDDSLLEEAYLMDAAGGHFLTDAFASGHLFDSAKVQVAIQRHLKDNPIRDENPEMQTVTAGLGMASILPSLVLKNIHDRMNTEGFDVTNAKGMKWKTYGDNHLKNAEETRKIAAYAVFVSRQQITRAKQGESPVASEVLDLLPDAKSVERATDQAYAYIPQAVREVAPLVHRNIGMLDTLKPPWYVGGPILPFVGKSIIGTISDPGRTKTLEDYERRKDLDRTTPYPTAPVIRFDF